MSSIEKMEQTCNYNVAIIGMGSQGYTTWFEFLRKGSKIAISAVCDNSKAVIDGFKVRHPEVPAYTDLNRLLEHHTVDFAVVCAPNKYHVSIIEQLAAAGVPCLKEKPVADTLAEFQALYRIPVKIGVAFQRRWQPRFLHLRNLLPIIGKPLSVRASLAGAYDPPHDGWRMTHSVGTFEDLGVHILDAVVWLFGRPSTVYSLRVDDAPLPARDRESHVVMSWGEGGLAGHLHVSEVALKKEEYVIVRGELGSLHLQGSKITHFNRYGRETFQTTFQSGKEDTLSAMCEEFGDFVTAKSASFDSSIERLEGSLLTALAVRDSFLSRKLEVVTDTRLNGAICATPPPETNGFVKEPHTSGELKNDDAKATGLNSGELKNGHPTNGNSTEHPTCQNDAKANAPTHFVLNTGYSIPALGFGTRKPKKPNQVYDAVKLAFAAGYRHIDSAFRYNNEDQVGMAVRDSGLPRNEVWITTKVDNSWHDRVAESVSLSLSKLGMDYIDLLLMHWPTATIADDPKKSLPDWDFIMTWQHMQREVETGRVRNIGVSNFGIRNLKKLLSHPTCTIIPAVNQLELHPCCPSSGLVEFCKDKGIHCTAYSPLACGLPQLYDNPTMEDLCKRLGKTPQQILIRWGLQRGTSVIPKTVTPERILANFDVAEWQLSPEDHSSLSLLEARCRVYPDDWLPERVFWEEDN
ncbi:hypothetical protein NLG97_g6503 [Lecanicillium saksenae]|uniref:Uncharacterized protein n=1 Tax=Lecanicillium saksenae TaxID=468837 RepID=A0ACC1QT91_9HYPO|nr:hypothetical protein NLG97_g6503 [Lecanicillium saksenae]